MWTLLFFPFMTWCSQEKDWVAEILPKGETGVEIQGHLHWWAKLWNIVTNSRSSVLKRKIKLTVSTYVNFKHWTYLQHIIRKNITIPFLHLSLSAVRLSLFDMKYGVLIKEFIAKPSQPLALTSHNLQNIFVSLMKASIYISHSVLLGKSLALGRFTFTELMKLYFSLCNISVGRYETFWPNFLPIRKLLAAFTNMSGPVLNLHILGPLNPQICTKLILQLADLFLNM